MAKQNSLASIEDGLRRLYQAVRQIHSFLDKPEVKEKVRLFFENLRTLPEDTKRFLRDLAYRGWFFTDEMTLNEISVFYNLITSQHSVDEAQIDAYMEKLIEKYTEHIKQHLYTRYPTRKGVLESAFNAHERGEYDLSIPPFLLRPTASALNCLAESLRSVVRPRPLRGCLPRQRRSTGSLLKWILCSLSH